MAPANLLVTDCGLRWHERMEMERDGGLQWALRSMWDCTEGIGKKTVLGLTPKLWLKGWNRKRSYAPEWRMLEGGLIW